MRRGISPGIKILVTFLLLIGFSICGYWALQISSGYLYLGLSTIISDSYIFWHILAEILAGVLAILSAYLILIKHPLGLRLAMFDCGMLLYTGINSTGWGLLHDPGLLTLFIICTIGAFLGLIYLSFKDEL
jgi:hypothetical protein